MIELFATSHLHVRRYTFHLIVQWKMPRWKPAHREDPDSKWGGSWECTN